MQNASELLSPSLEGKSGAAWLSAVEDITDVLGFFQPLSRRHSAAFVQSGTTLLVTFEPMQAIAKLSPQAHPTGWDMVREENWSHLAFICDEHTWFRDPAVYRFIDTLSDDGFFDAFDQVLFYGAGPAGYAACAFSVAAPGAKVLALTPQATLDPRVTEWDDRFRRMRRVDFNDRYGYAPDMLEAADHAYIIYDPKVEMDAMHAALFTRPNVTKLRMPYFGAHLDVQLTRMDALAPLLADIGAGANVAQSFHTLHRQRRLDRNYLRSIASDLEDNERWPLAARVYRYAGEALNAPRFRRRLAQIEEQMATDQPTENGETTLPPTPITEM